MSLVLPRIVASDPLPIVRATGISPVAAVVSLSLISFALCWPQIQDVWRTGTFFDTDDAMRMVQVRAWLAGQSWFDLTAHRLSPPDGLPMHWSRMVDVPLGGLIRLFSLAVAGDTAERLARIVFPLALQVVLIAATVFAGRVLAGPASSVPAAGLIVVSGFQFGQFVPGRIDHHAPQIVLLMAMVGSTADVLLSGRSRSAGVAALAIACSVAISLENLPFVAVVVSAMALTWAVVGAAQAKALRVFGCALIVGTLVSFAATVPPARYLVVSADAFSLPHLLSAMVGGGALMILAGPRTRLVSVPRRMASLGIAGSVALVLVVLSCPGVLQGPYAAIDPVVRSLWLSHVTEAQPLYTAVALHPHYLSLIVLPITAGLVAIALSAAWSRGRQRAAWCFVGCLALVGVAGSCWELRVAASAMPLAILGGVGVVTAVLSGGKQASGRRPLALALSCVLGPLFSPIAWLALPVADEPAAAQAASESAAACRAAGNVMPLSRLAPGLIFASIDSGSHLLVYTQLSVIGAPYHRHNSGNRTVIDGFTADPGDAAAIVRATGARYLAICPGQVVENRALMDRNPQGLAAEILAGHPPAWLERLAVPGSTYQVFAVR